MGRYNLNVLSYGLGRLRNSPSGINRVYNFVNRSDGNLGPQFFWNIVNPAPQPQPNINQVDEKNIVALLIFSYNLDLNVKNTLEYYFQKYSSIYPNFEIVDTTDSVEKTLFLLDKYYNDGCRNFIISSKTPIINGIYNWFDTHINALGFSSYGQITNILPTKIFTLGRTISSSDLYIDFSIIPYDNIYFIYIKN